MVLHRSSGVASAPLDETRETTAPPGHGAATLAGTRILLGWVFLWTFLDKTFGLGFGTPRGESWLAGVSPTRGFLTGSAGTFGAVFRALAGQSWVDWAFMLGMLLVGTALVLGVAMRLAAVGTRFGFGRRWSALTPVRRRRWLA